MRKTRIILPILLVLVVHTTFAATGSITWYKFSKKFITDHDILRLPDFEREDFETERAGRRLNLARLQYGIGKADIDHDRQTAETGDDLAQKFEPLARQVSRQHRPAGDVAARSR